MFYEKAVKQEQSEFYELLHDEKPIISLELDQWIDFLISFRNLIVPPEIYILLVIIFPLFPPTSQSSVFVHLGQIDFGFGEAEITSISGLEETFRTGFMFGLVL